MKGAGRTSMQRPHTAAGYGSRERASHAARGFGDDGVNRSISAMPNTTRESSVYEPKNRSRLAPEPEAPIDLSKFPFPVLLNDMCTRAVQDIRDQIQSAHDAHIEAKDKTIRDLRVENEELKNRMYLWETKYGPFAMSSPTEEDTEPQHAKREMSYQEIMAQRDQVGAASSGLRKEKSEAELLLESTQPDESAAQKFSRVARKFGEMKEGKTEGWTRTIKTEPSTGFLTELIATNRFENLIVFTLYLAKIGGHLPSAKWDQDTEEERKNRPMSPCGYMNVDNNQLGDDGVNMFFGFLLRHRIAVQALKIEKNNVTDLSVPAIINYIKECEPPMLDLYIGQNNLSGNGLRLILSTIQQLKGKYPVPAPEMPRAFFLFATKNRPKSAHALKIQIKQTAAMGEKDLALTIDEDEPTPYIAEI